MNLLTKTALATASLATFLSAPVMAFAAIPDGNGPWADYVLSSNQGLMKNGSAVPAARSNPQAAVGVAEDNTTDTNFFSLGFGGKIALGFQNGISSGVVVVEATNPNYPTEQAKVEVSSDGINWVSAGNVTQDGQVSIPSSVTCANFVRLTDISDPNTFSDPTADGFDVDGVKAVGNACPPPPTTGGNDCNLTVSQANNSVITTVVSSTANTGKNKAKKNTGGSNTIVTGNSNSTVNVTVSGSTNTANTTCCNCGTGGTNISIVGNGAGSTNTVTVIKN